MNIDYSKIKINKIIYNKESYNVIIKEYDEQGLHLYYETKDFLNQYSDIDNLYKQDFIYCIDDNNIKITLFNVIFTIRIDSNGRKFVDMNFPEAIYNGFFENKDILCNKIKVIFNSDTTGSNFRLFDFKEVKINDEKIIIKGNSIEYSCSNDVDSKYIYNRFMELYQYLNILLGYFPQIERVLFCYNNENYESLFSIPWKFNTAKRYFKNELCYINNMKENDFIQSFQRFLKIKETIQLQLDVFWNAQRGDTYPELEIVGVLQSIDGVFNKLTMFKDKSQLFKEDLKQEIVSKCLSLDFSEIIKETQDVEIETIISNNLNRINEITIRNKYKEFTNYKEIVFNNEIKSNNLKNLIEKFVNTRNKFSHVNTEDNKKYLNGKESAIYIEKLITVFRLHIMDEIGVKYNNEILKKHIDSIDSKFV